MSENPRGTNAFDPTDERTADQSTESANGLAGGRLKPVDSADGDCADEHDTPRRYDQPSSEDPGPTAKI